MHDRRHLGYELFELLISSVTELADDFVAIGSPSRNALLQAHVQIIHHLCDALAIALTLAVDQAEPANAGPSPAPARGDDALTITSDDPRAHLEELERLTDG